MKSQDLKGILSNTLIAVSFTIVMSIITFIFLGLSTLFHPTASLILLGSELAKLLAAGSIYFAAQVLFLPHHFQLKFPTPICLTSVTFLTGLFLIGVIFQIQSQFQRLLPFLVVTISMLWTGLSEELIYRQLSFQFYRQINWQVLLWQAAIFAFIGHYGGLDEIITNFVLRLPLGLLFGWLFNKWHNLWLVSWLHGLYDLIVYLNLLP